MGWAVLELLEHLMGDLQRRWVVEQFHACKIWDPSGREGVDWFHEHDPKLAFDQRQTDVEGSRAYAIGFEPDIDHIRAVSAYPMADIKRRNPERSAKAFKHLRVTQGLASWAKIPALLPKVWHVPHIGQADGSKIADEDIPRWFDDRCEFPAMYVSDRHTC